MKPKLTASERDELAALDARKLHTYVGFSVVRHFFAERSDAARFMELKVKAGADRPVFYGCECEFRVSQSEWHGGGCWEFSEG